MAELANKSELQKLLNRLSRQVEAGLPQAQKKAAKFMQKRLEERFKTGGYGQWAEISEWAKSERKVRKGGDPPLWDTGDLWREFSTPHDEGSGSTEFTSEREDAAEHNDGEGREPARPFAYLSDDDIDGVTRIYEEELDKQFKSGESLLEGVGAWA